MGLESGQVIKNIIKDAQRNNAALLHKKKILPWDFIGNICLVNQPNLFEMMKIRGKFRI